MTPAKPENDNSDEIAAALAAVYAYCQSEEVSEAAGDEDKPLSNWGAAGRMQGMNPAAGGIVSTSQIRSKFFTWRNSFARKWTAYSVLILALAGSFTSPALALERIQFIPPGESAGRGPQAESGSLRTAGRGPQAESGSLRTAGGSPAHAPSTDPSVLNEAGWQPALPAAPAMQISGQEQVQTRTARSMQLPTQIQAPPVVSQEMNSLRSRQDGGAPSPLQEKGIPSMPPTQSSAAANPSSTGSNGTIRVALNCSTSTADIVLPDGGQIYDEASQKLLAELPPQSYWQIKEVNGYSGKQLQLLGKTGSTANNRVLLASGLSNYEPAAYTRKFVSSVKSGFTRPPRIIDADGAKFALPVKTIAAQPVPAGEESKVRQVSTQNKSAINSSAKPVPPPPVVSGYVISTSRQNGVVSFNGKTYRGKLIIKPRNGEDPNFLVINQLDLEDYLLSVLPSEMPPYWGLDALKAQSIAARSYALANMNKHDKEGYDLKASTEDQVYLGVQTETEQSNRAVAETTGQVLKHNGKVVSAFFHSASGGATETSEHVYGGKVHYLKSVPDFDDQSPHFAWNRSIPVASIEENLKKQGRDIGGLLGIFPLERSQSQRVSSAMLCGTLQTLIVSGEELRRVLGLPSTFFNLGITQDAYLIAGRGFGHGLGMSQWGAKFLSEQGYNAAQILSYYYKDVSVEKF